MKLTANTINVTNTFSTARMTLANTNVVESITLGNVSVTPSQITVGNVSITPTAVSVPSLIVGGSVFDGPGSQGGIINYQEFTANGTWINPLAIVRQQPSVSQGLTYSYYTQGSSTNPATEAGLDALFDTSTVSPTVTFGGTGIHSGTINWGDSGQTGAGGVVGSKPSYLPANTFSWMVEGFIRAPETGTYSFGVDGDDALDLFVNEVNVANWYGGHGFQGAWTGGAGQTSGTITLIGNTYYSFKARMQEGSGADGIQVGWRKPSDGSIALIPANAFFYGTVANNVSLTGYEQAFVMAWGGGGGASSNNTNARSGGGGACVFGSYNLSSLPNTVSVTVGLGGALARTTTSTLAAAGNGGNSVFSSLTAYGGGGANSASAGIGGGWIATSTGGVSTRPLPSLSSTFGGGSGSNNPGPSSLFGGGGGVGVGGANGGLSIYGGGAGGTRGTSGSGNVGGISVFGGNGGSGNLAEAGFVPGGGGGSNTSASNTGARGEVRVWVFGPATTTLGIPTYALSPNVSTVNVGGAVLYTVSTTNLANNTTLYYTLNNSSTATSADFTTAVNGFVIVSNQSAQYTITTNSSSVANKNFYFDLRTGSATGTIVGNSSITTTNPTYALSPNTASFFESGSVLYTITTQGVANGTTLYYSLNNSSTATSADFSTAVNGSVIINGNANTFTLTAADDADGAETFYVDLRTGSTSGTLVANSSTVTINPKTYALTANVTSFYEGTSVRYTITTTGVTNGTTLYYTLNNSSTATSADFSTAVNGSVVINGGSNSFVLTSVIDGDSTNEAFRMDMRTGSTTGTIVATNNSVSITALPNSSWIASYNSIANTTSYTFNSVSWGSIPSSDRYIVVAVGARSGNTQAAITSMTIGGTAAALTATAAANQPRAVGIASVPTGTSGTVVVNSDQNLDVAVIGVWAVYGVTSTTAVDSAANTNLGSPISTTISTGLSAGDFVASVGIGAQDTEHVWTGGSPAITEDFQGTFLDSQIKVSFGSAILSGSGSQTYTVNTNVSVANRSSMATVVYSR